MTYTQKALSLLLGIFILLGLFLLLVYYPASQKLNSLKSEEKIIEKKIAEAEIRKARLPEIENEIEIARQNLQRLEVQYPKTIDGVWQAIVDAAQEVGLSTSRRETSEEPPAKETGAVRKRDIEIKASGGYQVLGEFLHQILILPVTISVSGLEIAREENSLLASEIEGDLQIELRLTAYLSKD